MTPRGGRQRIVRDASQRTKMSQALECPRCRGATADKAPPGSRRSGRCPACGMELIPASALREDQVRRYLYGHRLLPLAPEPAHDEERRR